MSAERVIVVADAAEASLAAARHIAASLRAAVAARGRADWATTGGSAAPGIYRHLADDPLRDEIPWEQVHVWWGDDRFVPRDHPLSNVKPLDDILLDWAQHEEGTSGGRPIVLLPIANLHPFRSGEAIGASRDAASVATAMAAELADAGLPVENGFPVLDLVVLGVGGDGHVLSVFPGSSAFEATAWAVDIPAPTHIEPHVPRVTMHPEIVRVARDVLVIAAGAGKADVLAEILGDERDERRWPGQLARHGRATWILDEAAAARLAR
ncbi:MAG: 6-phosphogluconolactonase [Candidatus Limnocylindrales bacterium]